MKFRNRTVIEEKEECDPERCELACAYGLWLCDGRCQELTSHCHRTCPANRTLGCQKYFDSSKGADNLRCFDRFDDFGQERKIHPPCGDICISPSLPCNATCLHPGEVR